jgi:zinc protease
MGRQLCGEVIEAALDNGVKVLVKPLRRSPIVTCWACYRVGSRNDPQGRTGSSHWTEHMLFKGTAKWGKGEIPRALSKRGGYFNGFTSEDQTVYFETLPSEHLDLALDIESDRMVNALFNPEEFEAERTVIIAEREGAENQPLYLLLEQVRAAAYEIHPYRVPIIGWKCDLRAISREELLEHYRSFYAPNNCTLVLVGDLEPDRTLEKVGGYFGAAPRQASPPQPRAEEPAQAGERRVAVKKPGTASYVIAAFHAPRASHEDAAALLVADAVLGGATGVGMGGSAHLGITSRLYRALVETKLAASAGCMFRLSLDPGLMMVYATVREGAQSDQVEQALRRELLNLAEEPVEEGELEKARRQIAAQWAYSLDGVTNQAYGLSLADRLDSCRLLDDLRSKALEVPSDEVARVARTYLHADNMTIGHFIPS